MIFILAYLVIGFLLFIESFKMISEKTNYPLIIFSVIVLIWPIVILFATIYAIIQVKNLLKRKDRKNKYDMRDLQK